MKDNQFIVLATSQNTNSFGLFQMIVANRDHDCFVTHASVYYVKPRLSVINRSIKYRCFLGHEMTYSAPNLVKADIIDNAWNQIVQS